MLGQKKRTEFLEKVPMFVGLSQRQLGAIAKVADEIDVPANKELATEGEVGREMFIIVEGTAKVVRKTRKVADLGPGDAFGEMSLADHQPRSASVITTSPVRVLVVPARAFKPLLQSVPKLAETLLAALSARLREADKQLYD